MSRDMITVGSTMRIPLLYWGEYSQWNERFMNYFEEQTDGEAMINSIKNGEHPLPVLKTRKIDRLARSLLIQGLPNDIYSLIDSNNTAKDLWDALERHMRGFEYGEQDRKATILYEYETFRATEGEQLLDTYLRYLQVINDLKKCGYKKDNCELNYKFLSNLQPEWKQYGTLMRQTKNLMDINIDALYNILKQNQGDVNDAMGYKKKAVMVTSDPLALVTEQTKVRKRREKVVVQSESEGSDDEDISDLKKITVLLAKAFNRKKYYAKPTNNNLRTSLASSSTNKKPEYVKSHEKKEDKKADEKKRDMSKVKCYNCKKEGYFAKDCKKAKVKDYNYYKTKMLLAKKDGDEQVLLAEDQAWMESSSDSDQEINANMVFIAKMEKVLSDSEESSSSAEETIAEVSYYSSDSESEFEYGTSEYYDNSTNYGLFVDNDNDQEIFHDAIESASENFNENHIVSQKDHDESEVDHNGSKEKDYLVDKLIKKYNQRLLNVRNIVDFTTVQNLRAKVKELQSENEHSKSKVADCTMCQNLQVRVEELKSVNESLNLSVEELSKARALAKETLRERDELISRQCKKMRLLEEQYEPFYEVQSEFDSEIVHDTHDNSKKDVILSLQTQLKETAELVVRFLDEKYYALKESRSLKVEIKSLQTENKVLKSRESELSEKIDQMKYQVSKLSEKLQISDQEMKQQIILFEEYKQMFLAKNEFLEKQRLETKFKFSKHDTSLEKMIEMIKKEYESNISKISIASSTFETKNLALVKEMGDKVKCFDEEKKVFETKISKLKKVLAQLVKDFDDVKTELSKRTDKFKTYFANLEKQNALLKSQLTSQNYTSLQKENNDLRTS
ncbi:retrovirus-related pol polyprotein from transposon TNT 1-94 [Tanacetum coccineum]